LLRTEDFATSAFVSAGELLGGIGKVRIACLLLDG
jgi:FixJ family two-component response regulator